MNDSAEKFFGQESEFDKLLKEKTKEGWQYIGVETLTQTKFSKEARFEEVQFQTEDDIKRKYNQSGKYKVELVFDSSQQWVSDLKKIVSPNEFDNFLRIENIPPERKKYFVFVREAK